LSNLTSSHFSPSSISLYASGSIGFISEPIVSSITTMNFPLYIFAYSSLRIAVRALPMWSGPDGKGASRITTFPFSALGSSFSPTLISRFDILCSSSLNFSFCFSGERFVTSWITSWISGIVFLICDFSSPSAKRAERIDFWFGLPSWFIAFSRAWAMINSEGINPVFGVSACRRVGVFVMGYRSN